MNRISLVAAGLIVVIANGFALLHGALNRRGSADAEVTLTNRELHNFYRSTSNDDSEVTLHLEWTDPGNFFGPSGLENLSHWFDQRKLQTLGFDCSMDPANPAAENFYRRQRPRQVFVALEYDGPAWQAWFASYELKVAQSPANLQAAGDSANDILHRSRLVAIDADRDAGQLRARHPDRASVVILPAVVATIFNSFPSAEVNPKHPAQVWGRIQELPTSIHVPRPFSDQFRRPDPHGGKAHDNTLSYRVHLRYGASLEPWVTGVEFTNGN